MSQRRDSIYVRSLCHVSPRIRRNELKNLTLGKHSNSYMIGKLSSFKEGDMAVILKKDGRYVGWSLTYGLGSGKPKSMFYVHCIDRDKGLGRQLFERTEKMLRSRGYKVMYVAPWNVGSRAFFTSMGCGLDKKGTSNSDLCHWIKSLR